MLDAVWCEKYRPKTLDECVIPQKTLTELKQYLKKGTIPNLLFCGTPGIGKTTAAQALMDESGVDYLKINASLEGNVDTIRTRVTQHASTVSFTGGRKFVVFEEFDKLSIAAQTALRAFIEEYSSNCGYVFTGNNVNALDSAISSRLNHVSFVFESSEKPVVAKKMYGIITDILTKEEIAFNPKDVQHLLVEYLKRSTDLRQLIIRVQKFSSSGTFTPDLSKLTDVRMQSLVSALKSKKVRDIRTWAGENSDLPPDLVFTFLFENVDQIASPAGIPAMIAHIAEHQFQNAFVVNSEINVAALLLDIASECI